MIIILMGVSGCGKTTVGQLLADQLDATFFDADDFHPPENVAKMRTGTPLTDSDRALWLKNLNGLLHGHAASSISTVLACSALKESYRKTLTKKIDPAPLFIFLRGSFDLIRTRMESRKDHYMPASLLRSQFDSLQPPKDAITVDIGAPPSEIVASIRSKVAARKGATP